MAIRDLFRTGTAEAMLIFNAGATCLIIVSLCLPVFARAMAAFGWGRPSSPSGERFQPDIIVIDVHGGYQRDDGAGRDVNRNGGGRFRRWTSRRRQAFF
jgi:hypothetical protein